MDAVICEVASRIDRSRVRGIGVSGQQHGFVPAGRGRPCHPACEALVRHEHSPRVRDPDPQARRPRRRDPQDRPPVPAGLHGPKGPVAKAPRARELQAAPAHPPAARLPELPPYRELFHGIRGRVRDGVPRRPQTRVVEGRDGGRGRPRRGLPAPALGLARGLRHAAPGDRGPLRFSRVHDRQRRRRRQHDGGDRHRQRGPRRRDRELRHERDDLRLFAQARRRPLGRDRRVLLLDRRMAARSCAR